MRGFLCFVLALMALAPVAKATEPAKFTATYALYAGGVRIIAVESLFDISPKAYHLRTDARTAGAFSKLLPWNGTFETTGDAGYKPVRHDYTVSWRGHGETSTFLYEPAGVFKSMTRTKDGAPLDEPVAPEVTEGTRDLLSTVALMLDGYNDKGACNADILTFDNQRSFTVQFRDIGDQQMDNARLSSYTGSAHGCTVEIVPKAGKWPKKPRGWLRIQQDAKAGGQLPVLWLAKPAANLPAIPVRIDIHTKYGNAIAHLSGIQ